MDIKLVDKDKHEEDIFDEMNECFVALENLDISNTPRISSTSPLTPKRSARQRHRPKKFGDFVGITSPTKRKKYCESISEEECNEPETECNVQPRKSTILFGADDVEGQELFQFGPRNSLGPSLQNRLPSSAPTTPRHKLLKRITTVETPKRVNNKIKNRIIAEVLSEDDGDFSESDSDYVPSDANDEDDDENESQTSSSESSTDDNLPLKPAKVPIRKSSRIMKPQNTSEYIMESDNYFLMNSNKKITTSDHTLEQLKHLSLESGDIKDDIFISEEHKINIEELNQLYETYFDKWCFILGMNFNIILYGAGSKICILEKFQALKLANIPCVVVNGFHPSITIKSVLESIIIDLLECSQVPDNISDVVHLIEEQLNSYDTELYLIVHNIDGCMLRNSKAQAMLAGISQIRKVHTIATIDHINGPLMWDQSKLSKFNFSWWDVTSFLPYIKETSYENSFASTNTSSLQLASLQSLYCALTKNAKGIFNIIIQYQLDNHKQTHYQGMPFEELYRMCRLQFLVSSEAGLRAQLTEFLDHHAVRLRRSGAGDVLMVPGHHSLLQHFLNEQQT